MARREEALDQLTQQTWDVVVIGGGATGLGAALDAVSRGYSAVLLEQSDFAKATSSRSTKLIHGGVRYLRQGNISLVRESLHERGLLLRNAPGLVRPLEFIVPTTSWWETMYYAVGLKAYDLLAGKLGMAASRKLSQQQVLDRAPTMKADGLHGGVSYSDAQFDDARLAVALAILIAEEGGVPLNYVSVRELLKSGNRLAGVRAEDRETGRTYDIQAKVVINATGIFSDNIRRLDEPQAAQTVQLSQGIHVVVDRRFLPGPSAIIIPETDDGRVLFFIPWHGSVLIGTTDTPVSQAKLEPRAQAAEIDYLLDYSRRYLTEAPTRADIRSCFAGLRPLARTGDEQVTSKISRDHVIRTSPSGLVSISGGKWTTFRKMGEDVVDAAAATGGLPHRSSETDDLKLGQQLVDLTVNDTESAHIPSQQQIQQMARVEMARTVEDVLARRSRLLFLDARVAIEHAPRVAEALAQELSRDADWPRQQVEEFTQTARGYLVSAGAASAEETPQRTATQPESL